MATNGRSVSGFTIATDIVAAVILAFGIAILFVAWQIKADWLAREDGREVRAHLVSVEKLDSSTWVEGKTKRQIDAEEEDDNTPWREDDGEGHWETSPYYLATYEFYVDDMRHTFSRDYGTSSDAYPDEVKALVYLDDDGEWKAEEPNSTRIAWFLVAAGSLWLVPQIVMSIFRRLRPREA